MVTSVQNIKFQIFEDKKQYKAFRQSWKDFINSGKHKPHYEVDSYGNKTKISSLTNVHHLLFYVILGKDLSVVFKPSVNPDKSPSFNHAYYELGLVIKLAKNVLAYDRGDDPGLPKYVTEERKTQFIESYRSRLSQLLRPFGDSLSLEMLSKLEDSLVGVTLTNK